MTRLDSRAAFARIAALEDQLDSLLIRPSVTAAAAQNLPLAAEHWSAAVWAAAAARGPIGLGTAEIARALKIAHRPLLVCGAHRSGTTLLRDLLDGHPALSVLPSEGSFFPSLERHLRRLRTEYWLPYMGCEWLRRLANPIHQQPYWLLGRSVQGSSAYVDFARALMAWWPLAREKVQGMSSWPLLAVALAYAHCTDGFSPISILERWAEKTPTNEQFLDRLRAEFPQAKFVHVVRHPFAVYASHKEYARSSGKRFRNAAQVLRDINLSYRAATAQARAGATDYLVLRYEDLVENMADTVARLAHFAGIPSVSNLMQPTVAGLPAMNNSSFAIHDPLGHVHSPPHRKWADTLTRSDCESITAVVGELAAALGYDLTPLARWRARLIRLDTRITSRLS